MVDILGIGASGLTAYRKLLETVGGNITNANTEGYVRRDVVLSGAGDSAMLPTAASNTSGSGVMVDMVRRANDAFLQVQALKANSLNLQSQTLADSLTQIEKTLFATTSNPGSIVQDFYSRFNDVANAPTSAAARISVLDSGKQVANVFTSAASAIEDSLGAIRSGLDAGLTAVNGITTQLGLLNVQIQSAATSGQKPNDLLDQRDKLLTSLSNLANFSYSEKPSGAVMVYLGETASGRPLVYADGSHPLGIIESGDKLEITMDPNSAPAPTNQLTSGTVAGLVDFRAQVKLLRDDINRLAVGFSVAVNEQHKQGVDLNGNQGGDLFSTDGLNAVAAKNNLGDAKLILTIDNAASINNVTYTARFNQSQNAWTIKSSEGKTVTDQNNLSMGGVSFKFDGQAKDGDTFTVSPLLGAASSMRFLVKTPAEVAVALPLYVDPSPANSGNADLRPLKRTEPDAATQVPPATSVFDSENPVNDFLKNGSAFILPAGASSATLTSLGDISAVHFNATGTQISALTSADGYGVSKLSLSIFVTGATNAVNGTKKDLPLFLKGSGLNDVADAINAAAQKAAANGDTDLKDALYASVSNGTLTITALNGKQVTTGALIGSGFDANGDPNQIKGANEPGSSAAVMRVFTRDGRQISGPPFDPASEGDAFVTPANGFLSDAEYNKNYLAIGYPRITSTEASKLLATTNYDTNASTLNTSAKIDVSTQSSFDMPQAGYGQAPLTGAVYALNVDGLDPIRLAGDSLAGAGPAEITAAIAARMNAQAPRVSWLGAPINFTDNMPSKIAFEVSIDGRQPPQTITFQRSQEPRNLKLKVTGNLIGEQEITIDKSAGTSKGVDWAYVDGKLQVSSRSDISIAIDPSLDYTALGFDGSEQGPPYTATRISSLLRETGTFDLGGATDLQVSLVTGGPEDKYNVTRLEVALKAGSLPGQTVELMSSDGSQVLATKTLTAAEATAGSVTFDRPLMGSDEVARLSAFQITPNGRENLSAPTAIDPAPPLSPPMQNSWAGASRVLITIPQKLRTTAPQISVAPASLLSASMLAETKPSIYVTRGSSGFRLTIDATQGKSNGISWKVDGGRLSLQSDDGSYIGIDTSTLQKKTLANALGFSDQQTPDSTIIGSQVGAIGLSTMGLADGKPFATSVTSPTDLTTSLLSSLKPTLHLTGNSIGDLAVKIDAPSGSQGRVSWATVDGKLVLSSDDLSVRFNRSASNDLEAEKLGFQPTQINSPLIAGSAVADALLNVTQPEISVLVGSVDNQSLYSFKIDSSSGFDAHSGVSWKVQNGRLAFVTGESALLIKGTTQAQRDTAKMLGFNGSDLDLSIESTITSANKLIPSLLAVKQPSLHVKGDKIGAQVLTIDRPNGTYNGVTWSLYDGKLTLTSTDATLKLDTATTDTLAMAKALGFTGQEAAGTQIIAVKSVASGMVESGSGLQFTISTGDNGDAPVTINKLSGTDPANGVSWSYDAVADRLMLSSTDASFKVKVSQTGARNAQALGFMGDGSDKKVESARLSLTSTATDRITDLADSRATVSHVGQAIQFDGGLPEDLVVDVRNLSADGLRRVAAKIDMAAVPPAPLRPDLQIKILSGGQLEIIDPESGASLAKRSWQQDIPVNYLGMSFTIHGNANAGDLYTIRNDSTRTSDNRNALRIAELATTSIFGKGQGSFQDVYAGVTSRLGSAVQASNMRASATSQAASDLKAAYEGKTGVNLDREASDLIRYQQAYQAAAQVIMAAREMFSTILKSF